MEATNKSGSCVIILLFLLCVKQAGWVLKVAGELATLHPLTKRTDKWQGDAEVQLRLKLPTIMEEEKLEEVRAIMGEWLCPLPTMQEVVAPQGKKEMQQEQMVLEVLLQEEQQEVVVVVVVAVPLQFQPLTMMEEQEEEVAT